MAAIVESTNELSAHRARSTARPSVVLLPAGAVAARLVRGARARPRVAPAQLIVGRNARLLAAGSGPTRRSGRDGRPTLCPSDLGRRRVRPAARRVPGLGGHGCPDALRVSSFSPASFGDGAPVTRVNSTGHVKRTTAPVVATGNEPLVTGRHTHRDRVVGIRVGRGRSRVAPSRVRGARPPSPRGRWPRRGRRTSRGRRRRHRPRRGSARRRCRSGRGAPCRRPRQGLGGDRVALEGVDLGGHAGAGRTRRRGEHGDQPRRVGTDEVHHGRAAPARPTTSAASGCPGGAAGRSGPRPRPPR